jgi:Na+/H+ antiporter NhaC
MQMKRENNKIFRFGFKKIFSISLLIIFHIFIFGMAFSGVSEFPAWTSILPPLVAIGLALIIREVVGALVLGLLVGSYLLSPSDMSDTILRLPTDLFLNALADKGHASIILFSLMLGGMVGIMAKCGGMAGIVKALGKISNTRRGGMITTWLMGLIIFFDDYANTLLVGNTIRPYTDKLKISRAKLAYIVDSTAAPVASIAVISTWVGFEIGLINDAIEPFSNLGNAYILFIKAIPYSAYSIFTLILVASIAFWNRDIGSMHKAEIAALKGTDTSAQSNNKNNLEQSESGRYPIIQAIVPILFVIVATFVGLYISGKNEIGGNGKLFEILGAADSSAILLFSSFMGMITAASLGMMFGKVKINDISEALIDGMRAMMPAMIILILAWSLGDICNRIGTAKFVIDSLTDTISPFFIPAALFVVAGLVAFSTGTSWGAMAILIPIAIPLAYELPLINGVSNSISDGILLGTIGAVLAGATFGDHCSPISDTTILSSMASGCNHIDHVQTQIPYALISALFALILGYIPSGFGVSPWIGIILGGLILILLPKFFKRNII